MYNNDNYYYYFFLIVSEQIQYPRTVTKIFSSGDQIIDNTVHHFRNRKIRYFFQSSYRRYAYNQTICGPSMWTREETGNRFKVFKIYDRKN